MKSNFFPGRTRRVIYHHFIRLAAAGLTLSPSAASRAVGFRATSLSKCPFNDRGARRNHSPQPTGTVPQVRRGGGLKDLLGTSSPPGPAGVSASRFISNHPYLLLCVGFFLGSLAFVFVPLVIFFSFFFWWWGCPYAMLSGTVGGSRAVRGAETRRRAGIAPEILGTSLLLPLSSGAPPVDAPAASCSVSPLHAPLRCAL